MKPERALIAERPLARHCPELLRPAAPAMDFAPALAQAGARLAERLPLDLAAVEGRGAALAVSAALPRACAGDALAGALPGPGEHLLLALENGVQAILSLPARAVLALLDRAFGGTGRVPDPFPEELPVSAGLLVERIQAAVCTALRAVLPAAGDATIAARASDLSHLHGIAPDAVFSLVEFSVEAEGAEPWALVLALPHAALPRLLGLTGAARGEQLQRRSDPLAEPFAEVRLELRAVIVDMRVPFSTVAGLEPGAILPVAIARSIPLVIGGKIVAHGVIGALDDRVAVQITPES